MDATDQNSTALTVDPTAGRDIAAELSYTRRLLDRVQAFSATGYWRYDIAAGQVDWSDRVFQIYGLSPTGRPVSFETAVGCYHPDDRQRVRDAISRSIETGEPFNFELRLVRPNGKMRHVIARGEAEAEPGAAPHAVFGVFQDVTGERNLQSERQRIEERLSLVVQASRDGIWDWSEDRPEVYYSDRFKELLGITRPGNYMPVDEARGRIHPEQADEFSRLVQHHLSGATHCEAELRLRCDDRSYRWMLVKAVAAPRAPGQPRRIVGTVGDIHDRKTDEQQLRHARAEAVAASRAKSQFVATVSHELRTPLNGVIGMLDLMDRDRLDAHQRSHLETASESARGLRAILDELLDLSKLDAGRLELAPVPFSPRQVIAGVAELFRPGAQSRGIGIAVEIDPAVPERLVADAARLRQIVSNLVGNALKFTDAGSVAVSALFEAAGDGTQNKLHVAVRDTGIGIPEEAQDRLFLPYSQIRGAGNTNAGGTGLGLAICKRLCEAMGGEIGVTSEAGKGSTFRFSVAARPALAREALAESEPAFLPAATTARAGAQRSVPEPGSPAVGHEAAPQAHLLIAEDNAVNQRVISAMLSRLGYSFEMVDNGVKAVEAVRGGKFDAVLMDVQMPQLDGVMATRLIREEECDRGGHIPIVAITAHAVDGTREEYIAAGMTEFIAKPIEVRKLALTLQEVLTPEAGSATPATGAAIA